MVNKKLENTYSQLKETERPAKRKGLRPMRMALIAAALAVGAVLCIAAGIPYQMYNYLSGGSITVFPAGNGIIGGAEIAVSNEKDAPLVLEDGRLWFINGGERTDVTDRMDENTPYIHENIDPATGNKGYLILGGTVDDFGWAEYAGLDGGAGMVGKNFFQIYMMLDGEWLLESELSSAQREQMNKLSEPEEDGVDSPRGVKTELVYQPWLKAAAEQLGIKDY